MATLTKEELWKKDKPDLIAYAKNHGISGYSGLNKPELIEYILNPPPKESQRSPGRPKGLGTPKVVATGQTRLTESKSWDIGTLKLINLVDLKKMLVELGVKGYSGKSKDEVLTKLLSLVPPTGFSLELEGKTITFISVGRTGSSPPRPSGLVTPMHMPAPAPMHMPAPAPMHIPAPAPMTTQQASIFQLPPILTQQKIQPTVAPMRPIIVELPPVVVQPSIKKLKEVKYENTRDITLEVNQKDYVVVQPEIGSLTVDKDSLITYVVIESDRNSQFGYVEKIVLVEATKLDKTTFMVFYDENALKITMYVNLSQGLVGWLTESGSTLNLSWNNTTV
jgi:hypothetical protein